MHVVIHIVSLQFFSIESRVDVVQNLQFTFSFFLVMHCNLFYLLGLPQKFHCSEAFMPFSKTFSWSLTFFSDSKRTSFAFTTIHRKVFGIHQIKFMQVVVSRLFQGFYDLSNKAHAL